MICKTPSSDLGMGGTGIRAIKLMNVMFTWMAAVSR